MRRLAFFSFCVLIILSLFLTGCEKKHPVIVIPPSVTATEQPFASTAPATPTPSVPSYSPEASVTAPTPSPSPATSKPVATKKPSASAAPSKAAPTANVPNKITLTNAKGSATFSIGMDVRTALNAYASLSNYQPTEEDIAIAMDFPNDKGEYGSDGYYGGPIPSGDINGEIALHFYNGKLNRIEVDSGDSPLVSGFSIGGINQTSTLGEIVSTLGNYSSQDRYQRTVYGFSGNTNSLSLTYNINGSLIQIIFG